MQICGSIVLYKNEEEILKRVIKCFFNTSVSVRLYLIDNSPTDELKNLGFGKAHNIALRKSIEENVEYHLVLNTDIQGGVIFGNYKTLFTQILAVIIIIFFSMFMTYIFLKFINIFTPVRITPELDHIGLDKVEHEEQLHN